MIRPPTGPTLFVKDVAEEKSMLNKTVIFETDLPRTTRKLQPTRVGMILKEQPLGKVTNASLMLKQELTTTFC